MSDRDIQFAKAMRRRIGLAALHSSVAAVQRRFGVSRAFVRYWRAKAVDHRFHSGSIGGRRNYFFERDEQLVVECVLRYEYQRNPQRTLHEFAESMRDNGFGVVNADWVRRVFSSWGYSWKRNYYTNANKFSRANMQYYPTYCAAVAVLPFAIVHFLDESHFYPKSMIERGWGPAGQRQRYSARFSSDPNFSLTVVTDLRSPEGYFVSEPRESSNTAVDFLLFVAGLIENQVVRAGDVLIADNAKIHFAREVSGFLTRLLDRIHARLIFLPTYSPELNPCELIFGQVKNYIRHHRSRGPYLVDLARAFASVNGRNVLKYYMKCIDHFDKD